MILLFSFWILCGILIVLIKLSFWRRNCSLLMPGSRPSFFNPLGDATHVLDISTSLDHRFFKIMEDCFNKYGNMSLYCLWIFYEPFVIFSKADAVKELLKGTAFNEKSWVYDFIKFFFGTGLLTSGGAKWKSRRKLLNTCFHKDILKDFQAVFDEHAQKLADFFRGETEKEFTYVEKPLKLSTLDIICETICGLPVRALENENSQYVKAISRLSEILMVQVCNIFLWPEFIFKYTRLYKEQTHHLKVLQDFTRSVIREKKDRYLRGGNNTDKRKRKALMDMLLDRHFNFQDFSEEDIREEVDTFIAEGHDTVAVCLMWTLFLIGHHPDVQSKLQAELDKAFGKDVDTSILVNDLNQLDYMECVIKESNRIYTIVPAYGRQFHEDTEICGHTIPKGSSGIVLSYFLHRDETIFPDPEKFDPDRFLPENEINIPDFAYIPFSAGPRNCIGKTFAMMEMKTILAAILRRFELHSLDGRDKVLPLMQVTLNPSIPIQIRFRYRQ